MHERLLAAGDPLAERLNRSLASGRRLADLIERLLDVSRLSNQQLVITREPVLLGGLVEQAVAATRARAERVGCALRCHGPAGVIGSWDRIRIEQVLSDLLDNALEFGRGQPVDVSFGGEGDTAWLRVEDRGGGVGDDDRERIFERFERAASMRNHGGLGLGLYLARRIAEAHGGKICVLSRDGGGSTFELRIPCAEPTIGAGGPT
ncbi:MAG: HAMP domain-containing histidine kinase [Deltaproteobacteria bacterium]|nr:HAMP domain-containing histidine kinase [Nannocystaceae bacterium]